MKSRYISGTDIPDFDVRLSEAMDSHADSKSGKTRVIAVENRAGEVYRIIQTEGLDELHGMTGALESMGFTDVLHSHDSTPTDGYDCRFVISP